VSRMRRGFTLIEMLIVIVVAGIILTYGFPKIRALLIKNNLRSARSALLTAMQQAKTWAVTDGRATTVHVDPGTGVLWLTATPRRVATPGSTVDTVGMVRNLTTVYGATVTATQNTFAFDQRGLLTPVSGAAQKVVLANAGYRDSVLINGYGRISK
jgi:prepilin-type N-terminal cleavage/methylation domain-containing protein